MPRTQSAKQCHLILGGLCLIVGLLGSIVLGAQALSVPEPHAIPGFIKAGFVSMFILIAIGTILTLIYTLDTLDDEWEESLKKRRDNNAE